MEMAEVALKIPYLQLLLKSYGVSDEEAEAFVALAEEANKPGWWQRFHDILPGWFSMYVSLEGAASLIRSYEPHFVPGLLQTEDYARGVLESGRHRPDQTRGHRAPCGAAHATPGAAHPRGRAPALGRDGRDRRCAAPSAAPR